MPDVGLAGDPYRLAVASDPVVVIAVDEQDASIPTTSIPGSASNTAAVRAQNSGIRRSSLSSTA